MVATALMLAGPVAAAAGRPPLRAVSASAVVIPQAASRYSNSTGTRNGARLPVRGARERCRLMSQQQQLFVPVEKTTVPKACVDGNRMVRIVLLSGEDAGPPRPGLAAMPG